MGEAAETMAKSSDLLKQVSTKNTLSTAMLTFQKAINGMIQDPNSNFTSKQKADLALLAEFRQKVELMAEPSEAGSSSDAMAEYIQKRKQFFGPGAESSEAGPSSESNEDNDSDTSDEPADPWAPFLRIRKLSLDPTIKNHVEQHGTDAGKFIKCLQDGEPSAADTTSSPQEYLVKCVLDARTLETKMKRNRLCRLYMYLMFYDLVTEFMPYVAPGEKPKAITLQQLKNIIGDTPLVDIMETELLENINRYSEYGATLQVFCTKLGQGSLFYLVDQLAEEL